MSNKYILLALMLCLLHSSCGEGDEDTLEEENQQSAKNFVEALESEELKDWVSPMNSEFRELIIKGGRPIGHVDYVGVMFIKESPVYEDNILEITVKMMIEEHLFKKRSYLLKAEKFAKHGTNGVEKPSIELKSIDGKVVNLIKGTKINECIIYYHVKLKEFNETQTWSIESNGKTDILLSPIVTERINRSMTSLYEKSIKNGKRGGGVLAVDIRF